MRSGRRSEVGTWPLAGQSTPGSSHQASPLRCGKVVAAGLPTAAAALVVGGLALGGCRFVQPASSAQPTRADTNQRHAAGRRPRSGADGSLLAEDASCVPVAAVFVAAGSVADRGRLG
jgi:hypothetical protein